MSAPYDPNARRDTPLALVLHERIARDGPLPVCGYMEACLTDPQHGYYRKWAAIGGGGDFITAPEISQTFGELVGLWAAVVWRQMGSPGRFSLVELGPGRGTLMRDALRAGRAVPGFLEAADVVLVDVAPTDFSPLRGLLPDGRLSVVDDVRAVSLEVPSIIIANEFLDTCPVQQFVIENGDIRIRAVGLADGRLELTSLGAPDRVDLWSVLADNPALGEGDIFEYQDFTVLQRLADGRSAPWAGLFIDYGHFHPERSENHVAPGDTLQAVRNHAYEHPLTSPGEADLTCHVDFNAVANHFTAQGGSATAMLTVDGPITQAEFLGRLGIIERASRLMSANPARAGEIEGGVKRLLSPQGMGTRFKAIAVRSALLPTLPGFE